jgi:hypothetical protein
VKALKGKWTRSFFFGVRKEDPSTKLLSSSEQEKQSGVEDREFCMLISIHSRVTGDTLLTVHEEILIS